MVTFLLIFGLVSAVVGIVILLALNTGSYPSYYDDYIGGYDGYEDDDSDPMDPLNHEAR